ncbi:hypothetical protein LSCM1_04360 [Leishmania martiniquensis]|uniref:Uncharacterized protein n=1 Tax=Leishmania martiniquensis TaxID=1580590 RepID=A0A836GXI8_9TRYP|nr:hypothetical protein LSCM1_04360 [Leishmania martiniquensis]
MQARTVSPGGVRPKGRKRNNAKAAVPNPVSFNVQDRRLNTRLLSEMQQRRAQLLGMTARDVAHQLYRYTVEPSSLMDEDRLREPRGRRSASRIKSATDGDPNSLINSSSNIHSTAMCSSPVRDAYSEWQTERRQHMSRKADNQEHSPLNPCTSSGERDERAGAVPLAPPTVLYEEWLAAGCPTGSWCALLQEEVYGPLEAERAFLRAKYDPKASPPS